jgi:hypothetical protein
MTFQAPTERCIRWSAWEGFETGIEHLDIRRKGSGIVAAGVLTGSDEVDGSYGLFYELAIDDGWRVRDAKLFLTSGPRLHLESDGRGSWRANGQGRPDLQGCADVDIQASPLTNTLPIRRLALDRGQSAVIGVVYIRVPSLVVEPVRQRYTALEPGSLYRFESLESPFKADLPVDGEGFVMNYPRLFRRWT